MKVLVTGSTGLIGSEVCRLLLTKKVEVVEYSLQKEKNILDEKQLKKDIKGCQAVIHLAAILDENEKPELIWNVNVNGTKNVLDAAASERVGRFVFLSSVGVYGNSLGIKNEKTLFSPETEYEKSKVKAEELVEQYQELVPYTIIRSALVLGPNRYWKQIFSIVKKNFPLMGKSDNLWQTIYYKDIANAVVFLLFLDAAENEVFLAAGEEKPTLKELVETIRSQYGLPTPAPVLPLWLGKILAFALGIKFGLRGKSNILSPSNIKRLLHERNYDLTKIHAYGWKAKFKYREALKETQKELEQKSETKP